jgi:hypothetical protein
MHVFVTGATGYTASLTASSSSPPRDARRQPGQPTGPDALEELERGSYART